MCYCLRIRILTVKLQGCIAISYLSDQTKENECWTTRSAEPMASRKERKELMSCRFNSKTGRDLLFELKAAMAFSCQNVKYLAKVSA